MSLSIYLSSIYLYINMISFKTKETGGEEKDGVRTGQYIAAGYTGDGMACAFAAAKALADMITLRLRPEDFVSAFSPSRFCRPQ